MTDSRPIPTYPPGWEGAAEALFTITSPDGDAFAWICPEIGGNAIAYAVRVGDDWVHVLDVPPSPSVLRDIPSRYGLPILYPFPGGMRGGTYQWSGQTRRVPPTYPTGSDPDGATVVIHGFAHIRAWRFVEQTAGSIVLDFRTPEALDPERAASYPFQTRLVHTISLGPDGLKSELVAHNLGSEDAPLALGLHPYFGAGVLGSDRSVVQVDLPGRSTRTRSVPAAGGRAAMDGGKEPVAAAPIGICKQGETMHASRTDLGPYPAVATVKNLPPLAGRDGWTVTLTMDAGFRDILMFAPPLQTSISIEPQSHMPGNCSLPEGHPEGLEGLAPGATRTATAWIRLVPPGGPS